MGTGVLQLPIGAAVLPDGSSGNAAPAIVRVQSSAANPKLHFLKALFDASTDEFLGWQFIMPDDYSSAAVLKLAYAMASATSGNVRVEARLAAITPGDSTDIDAKALAATNSAGDAVAGTAGYVKEISVTLTNADSVAAGDWVTLWINRDADGTTGTDDATGDMELVGARLTYTST